MDIRIQKTQEAIFEAFFELLNEESFHQISVSQIIEKARIGRSTFYSHFASKDDLLVAVSSQLFEHVFKTSSYAEHTRGVKQGKEDSLLDLLTHLFQHFKDNENKVTTLFEMDDPYFYRNFRKELQDYLVPLVKTVYFQDVHLPDSLVDQQIAESFMTCLRWWLAQKDKISARAVSFYFLQILV